MTPQKFILPQLLKIAKMVWDAAALWWEEWAVPWLRTSFREGMIPASSLSYLSKSIHPLSVQLNQFGWWFMKEWKALASVCNPKISLNCLSLFSGEATTKQIHWSSDWIYSSFSAKSSDKPTRIGMGSSLWLLQPLPNADAPSPSGNELTFLHTSNDWVHLSFFLSFFLKVLLCYCCLFTPGEKKGCPQLWFVSDVKRMDFGCLCWQDSPAFGSQLDLLRNETHLWTSFGLRSLSTSR